MTPAFLLALALLGAPAAVTPAGAPAGPPYYARPVSPDADLARLRAEMAAAASGKPGAGGPEAAEWHRVLETYLALGELQTIPELVALMAEAFPDDPAFQEGRMMFLSLGGEHPAAIALGEEILRRFPDYATIRANLGRVYLAAGDRARGVNLLIAALERGPIRVEEWKLLLEGLGAAGDQALPGDQLLATLRKKVEADPRRASLHYLLMVVLTRLGRYGEAREILERHPELAGHPDLRLFAEQVAAQPAAAAAGRP